MFATTLWCQLFVTISCTIVAVLVAWLNQVFSHIEIFYINAELDVMMVVQIFNSNINIIFLLGA